MENIFKIDYNDLFDEEALEKIRETVERINNNKIGIEEVIKHYYIEDENKEKEEKMTFQDAYDMCDFEIQCRYNYLDQLLCEIDDEIMYLTEELEKAKVNGEIAKELINNNEEIARKLFEDYGEINEKTLSNGFRIEKIQEEIDYLYEKYEIVMDMYDEVFLGILANIE